MLSSSKNGSSIISADSTLSPLLHVSSMASGTKSYLVEPPGLRSLSDTVVTIASWIAEVGFIGVVIGCLAIASVPFYSGASFFGGLLFN